MSRERSSIECTHGRGFNCRRCWPSEQERERAVQFWLARQQDKAREQAAQLVAAIRAAGLQPMAYSGRFMYGQQCVAVSVDTLAQAETLVQSHGVPLKGCKTDALGNGRVIYWPDMPADKLNDSEAA